MRFRDRVDAGRKLAVRLGDDAGRSDAGAGPAARRRPVGAEVSRALGVPLDVFLVRKLGVPGHFELAMGAIAAGGIEVLNEGLIRDLGIPQSLVQQVAVRERLELDRRDRLFRGGRPAISVRGRTILLIDDGLATGSTMQAAVTALKPQGASRSLWPCPWVPGRPALI
jgi:predicted phosphoribosyltransferase